jgi:hypothetical protein
MADKPLEFDGGLDDLWMVSNVTPEGVAARITTSEAALEAIGAALQ